MGVYIHTKPIDRGAWTPMTRLRAVTVNSVARAISYIARMMSGICRNDLTMAGTMLILIPSWRKNEKMMMMNSS
jgi:hypothetical protein